MMPGDRQHAAELLRRARRESGEAAAESAAWARCIVPESRGALRLAINLAIREEDHHHADALIAQGLLLWPDDAGLLVHQAGRLAARGLAEQALHAIERAAAQRPHHVATRLLAGAAAEQCNAAEVAIVHYEAAASAAPLHRVDEGLAALFALHLKRDEIDAAARALRRFRAAPPVILQARLLRARQCMPDAIDLLETSLDSPEDPADHDETLCELITLCDATFDDDRVLEHIARTGAATPRARIRAAEALLRMGRFEEAGRCAMDLFDNSAVASEAASVAAIASMAAGAVDEASMRIERLAPHEKPEPSALARLWRRALLGRLLNEIREGCAPAGESPLAELIRWAHGVFASAPRGDESAGRHRALCQAAMLGREA